MSLLKEKPKILEHDIFTKIFEVSELLNMDKETRLKIIHNMTTERDLRNQMAYAREEAIREGRAEGMAEGMAQGMAQGMAETIRKMLAGGISAGAIAEALGMTVEECETYR